MFDVSMVELAVIALVALLVLGPEKLPRAARTVGLYVRKARQSWYSVRSEIERELAADELKRSLEQTEDTLRAAAVEGQATAQSVVSSLGVMEPAQTIAVSREETPPPRSEPPA